MRITQSWVLDSFKESFNKRWGTHSNYLVNTKPIVVFGCFHQNQVDVIARHAAPVVVVWIGSDSMYLRTGQFGVDYSKILNAPHIKHIAISKWIIDDLSACGVPHIYLPITHVDFEQFKPVPLGNSVYCYCPKTRPELYGRKILNAVRKRMLDVEFVVTNKHTNYGHKFMPEVYADCFCGLRLTSHDVQPTTVAEMGLMGRRVIHNGLAPNCIPWRGVDDIVESIRREQERMVNITVSNCAINTVDLSKRVQKFLDIGDAWLNTEYYKGTEK